MFLLPKGEIEGRFDPFFYKAEFIQLEKKVKAKSTLVLRDFVLNIASGATPLTTESDKYYVENADEGVPFLRVQNLTTEGVLNITDCKYINHTTHQTMLKRSQVGEDDLLVKITGVGRMAIASVAPKGFRGNINQHVVVIKTKDRRTSEILAAYLNTDIAEKLATRRSTGGTRPALDYPALLSLPIIFDERVLEIMQNKVAEKHIVMHQAETLLSSTDAYLLDALGIQLPTPPSVNLSERVFLSNFSDIEGLRFDPFFNNIYHKTVKSAIRTFRNVVNFEEVLTDLKNGVEIRDYVEQGGVRYLRVTDLGKNEINNNSPRFVADQSIPSKIKLNQNCVLISRSGSLGLVSVVDDSLERVILSSHIFKAELDTERVLPDYIVALMRSQIGQIQIFQNNNGGVIPEINQNALKSILIPLPPLSIQEKIATHIRNLHTEVQALKTKAEATIIEAKAEIERILFE